MYTDLISLGTALDMQRERGPRWCVWGTIRQGQMMAGYAATAEEAERLEGFYQDAGYYQVKIFPPAGSVDLGELGRDRAAARTALDEATLTLKAAVLQALAEGRSESEVALSAGVDRMTVRAWAGKR